MAKGHSILTSFLCLHILRTSGGTAEPKCFVNLYRFRHWGAFTIYVKSNRSQSYLSQGEQTNLFFPSEIFLTAKFKTIVASNGIPSIKRQCHFPTLSSCVQTPPRTSSGVPFRSQVFLPKLGCMPSRVFVRTWKPSVSTDSVDRQMVAWGFSEDHGAGLVCEESTNGLYAVAQGREGEAAPQATG